MTTSLVTGANRGIGLELVKHLKAHASYSWDRSFSELEFDDYQANVLLGGLIWTF